MGLLLRPGTAHKDLLKIDILFFGGIIPGPKLFQPLPSGLFITIVQGPDRQIRLIIRPIDLGLFFIQNAFLRIILNSLITEAQRLLMISGFGQTVDLKKVLIQRNRLALYPPKSSRSCQQNHHDYHPSAQPLSGLLFH